MATIGRIAVDLTVATRGLTAGLKRARKQFSSFSGGFRKTGSAVTRTLGTVFGGATLIGGPLAFAAALNKLGRTSEDFNRAMTNSLAIMGDVGPKIRQQMTNVAIDVAKQTKFSAKEAADAYFFLASAGMNAAQSMKAMPLVAKFAQAGNFDLARATDLLTDAQSALGMASKDPIENLKQMTRVADVLVKANTLANASVEQLSEALTNKAGAALRVNNKSLEEGVAVLAAFADRGVKGAQAGEYLSIILRDIPRALARTQKAAKPAMLTFADVEAAMRSNADAFEKLGIKVRMGKNQFMPAAKVTAMLGKSLHFMAEADRVASLNMLGLSKYVKAVPGPFSKMGIAVADSDGKLLSLGQIVTNISTKLAGMSDVDKASALDQLGLTRSVADAIKVLAGAGGQIANYQTALQAAGGTTEEVAAKQMTPFQAAINKMSAAWEEFSIKIGTPALEVFAALIETVTSLFGDMGGTSEESMSKIRNNIVSVAESLASVLDLGRAFKIMFKGAQTGITALIADILSLGKPLANLLNYLGIATDKADAFLAIQSDLEKLAQQQATETSALIDAPLASTAFKKRLAELRTQPASTPAASLTSGQDKATDTTVAEQLTESQKQTALIQEQNLILRKQLKFGTT